MAARRATKHVKRDPGRSILSLINSFNLPVSGQLFEGSKQSDK